MGRTLDGRLAETTVTRRRLLNSARGDQEVFDAFDSLNDRFRKLEQTRDAFCDDGLLNRVKHRLVIMTKNRCEQILGETE